MADEVFKEIDVLGITGDGLAETAVQAAGLDNATYNADEAKQALDQVTNFKKELMG